jgi:hypothetical protein
MFSSLSLKKFSEARVSSLITFKQLLPIVAAQLAGAHISESFETSDSISGFYPVFLGFQPQFLSKATRRTFFIFHFRHEYSLGRESAPHFVYTQLEPQCYPHFSTFFSLIGWISRCPFYRLPPFLSCVPPYVCCWNDRKRSIVVSAEIRVDFRIRFLPKRLFTSFCHSNSKHRVVHDKNGGKR